MTNLPLPARWIRQLLFLSRPMPLILALSPLHQLRPRALILLLPFLLTRAAALLLPCKMRAAALIPEFIIRSLPPLLVRRIIVIIIQLIYQQSLVTAFRVLQLALRLMLVMTRAALMSAVTKEQRGI